MYLLVSSMNALLMVKQNRAGEIPPFLNMKKLLLIILVLWAATGSAQTVGQFRYDTTKFLKVGGRNHVMIENLITVTDSTYKPLVVGADGVIKRNSYWPGTGSGGSGGSGITSLGTGYGLVNVNDSTYRVDTTVIASKDYVDAKDALKLDSVGISTDTVYGWKNGVRHYQFKSPAFANWLTNGTKIYTTATNVGIGVDTPFAQLHITANSIGSSSVLNKGLYLQNNTNTNLETSPAVTFQTSYTNPFFWQVYTRQVSFAPSVSELIFASKYNTGSLNEVFKVNSVGGITASSFIASGGTVSAATGSFNHGWYSGGAFTFSNNNVTTNLNKWFTIRNTTSASGVSPEYSPGLRIYGSGWSGSASQTLEFTQQVRPISGTNPITGKLHWFSQVAALGDVDAMRLTNAGTLETNDLLLGGSTKDASSIADLQSTTKGFLPPRMTGTQAEAIASPAEGLLIYSTDGSGSTITSKGWWGWSGSAWEKLN